MRTPRIGELALAFGYATVDELHAEHLLTEQRRWQPSGEAGEAEAISDLP